MQVSAYVIFLLLLAYAECQQTNGNIWDMLINDGDSNKIEQPFVFEKAPTPSSVSYGPVPVASSSNVGISVGAGGSFTPSGVIGAKVEILKLLESFIRFKGEIVSRLYAVVVDNWDLIKLLTNAVISRIGTLQAFTINGIIILRNILEFANNLIGSWKITVPNVNVDFSTLLRESDLYNVYKK